MQNARKDREFRNDDERNPIDPADQPTHDESEDATSGSEGGGPRIGYSKPGEDEPPHVRRPRPK